MTLHKQASSSTLSGVRSLPSSKLILIFALVAVVVSVVVLVVKYSGEGTPPATTANQSPKKVLGPFRGLAPARKSANSASQDIQETFLRCTLENAMGDEKVLHAPKGVQPGTLVSPPVGETPTAPLYDSKYGFKSNFKPDVTERMSVSRSPLKSRDEVKSGLNEISRKFDSFLSEKVFPNAVVMQEEDGSFTIQQDEDSDQCVFLENYYEYVQASMAAALDEPPDSTLNWAKGSNLSLAFADIDDNVEALRVGLKVLCSSTGGYVTTNTGHIKSLSTSDVVGYMVKWPGDQTVLLRHFATME